VRGFNVFWKQADLAEPPDRKNMKDAYLHPQYTTIEELKEMGL
jgi:hypothetical protein